ncbi:Hydroxyindole O-methyltransferase [Myotis brandtii]|uniref:Acetylserotonin O-methyltransferase n=1 Tax=Myotis brandtii TaxID=109478 RepID=S7MPW0_MYOBR|nr:Hydroxyindole O-methyltransferase [Myotis brandtii]
MSCPEGHPSPGLLDQYSQGFMVSQVLFAACELGVFDVLAEAPGPLGSEAVAAHLGTSSRGTELLLDTCVSLNLLQVEMRGGKVREPSGDVLEAGEAPATAAALARPLYDNTQLSSTYLLRSSPSSQYHMMLYLARTTYLCWAHLAQAVREGKNQYLKAFGVPSEELFTAIYREGKNQYLKAFGVPSEELFTAIYRSEGERLLFMRALQDVWSVQGSGVLAAFDLSPFPLVCDLGGCSGALAKECVSLYPGCRVTVFDIPSVVRAAKDHFLSPEEGRIGFHEGGGVLVVESLLDTDGRGPLTTQLYSLNMLVQTEGRERTPAQYRALLAAAGFGDVQCKRTPGTYGAILARK